MEKKYSSYFSILKAALYIDITRRGKDFVTIFVPFLLFPLMMLASFFLSFFPDRSAWANSACSGPILSVAHTQPNNITSRHRWEEKELSTLGGGGGGDCTHARTHTHAHTHAREKDRKGNGKGTGEGRDRKREEKAAPICSTVTEKRDERKKEREILRI